MENQTTTTTCRSCLPRKQSKLTTRSSSPQTRMIDVVKSNWKRNVDRKPAEASKRVDYTESDTSKLIINKPVWAQLTNARGRHSYAPSHLAFRHYELHLEKYLEIPICNSNWDMRYLWSKCADRTDEATSKLIINEPVRALGHTTPEMRMRKPIEWWMKGVSSAWQNGNNCVCLPAG